MRVLFIFICIIAANRVGAYVHDSWTDLQDRSALIVCSEPAFTFPPGEYYFDYESGIACLFPTSQNDYNRVVRRC